MEISFWFSSQLDHQTATNFCIYHDSLAVVAYAQICSNHNLDDNEFKFMFKFDCDGKIVCKMVL